MFRLTAMRPITPPNGLRISVTMIGRCQWIFGSSDAALKSLRSPQSGEADVIWHPAKKKGANARFKLKILCFEIDGRFLPEVIEVGCQPFSGPRPAYLVKMAKKIPIVVQSAGAGQLADHVFGFDDVN